MNKSWMTDLQKEYSKRTHTVSGDEKLFDTQLLNIRCTGWRMMLSTEHAPVSEFMLQYGDISQCYSVAWFDTQADLVEFMFTQLEQAFK